MKILQALRAPFIAMTMAMASFAVGSTAEGGVVIVDQQQTSYAEVNDWLNVSQTLTAGIDGSLLGISVVVEGRKRLGDYPYGSDFNIRLHASNEEHELIGPVLAEGSGFRTDVELENPVWITVWFNTPYEQSNGELLGFTIESLSRGPEGWNEYGAALNDPYPNGRGYPYNDHLDLDLAFKTHVQVPEPTAGMLFLLSASFLLVLRKRFSPGFQYPSPATSLGTR